jgi:alcohol dehydrogenase (cytochrome c)
VLALDPDDGLIRWHYQFTPHDVWDYDGVNENILFDLDGRKLLAHFDKNGHLFILDRQTGELQRAVPFYDNTWGTIDERTGKVTVRLEPTPEGTEICPGPAGAKEWPHASFSPQTQLLYTPVVDACSTFKLMRTEFRESVPYWGGDATVAATHVRGWRGQSVRSIQWAGSVAMAFPASDRRLATEHRRRRGVRRRAHRRVQCARCQNWQTPVAISNRQRNS